MKLIIGIGNPGLEYENTRHNVGFMAVDEIAKKHNLSFNKEKFNALYTDFNLDGEKIILMKPQTYVNLSGTAVLSMMNFFKIDVDDILVIYDDLNLPTGKIRVRAKGSAGGHNGMKSIIKYLKTDQFKRIRIGIDRSERIEQVDYVLGRFTKVELEAIGPSLKRLEEVPQDFARKNFSDFMNKYNR